MSRTKKKDRNQNKREKKYYIWYVLLIYGVVIQFVLIGFMGTVGNDFILGEYIASKKLLVDAIIMIGMLGSVLITGYIRRKIVVISNLDFRILKLREQHCIIVISFAAMFIVEWVLACVNIMLLPVWALLKKFSDWQNTMKQNKKEQQNQLMKKYVREHIKQLPSIYLCNLESLERRRFLLVLQQNRKSLMDRILQSILALGHRLGNNFIFLAMGSLLCLLVYEGEMAIGEALLYLFSLSTLMSSLNFVISVPNTNRDSL